MSGISIGNLPNQSILKKINDIAADVDNLDLEGVNNLKSKLSELVAPELGSSDTKAISQKVVTENIQQLNTEVNNKINKVESAQNGNLPSFDNGHIKDSKIPASNIAQANGYYESMIVGASKNLAGNNIVTAKYTYRPTADTTDVADGVAKISSVKGNTIVWNQKIHNFVYSYKSNGLTFDRSNQVISITGTLPSTFPITLPIEVMGGVIAGHKYLFGANEQMPEGFYLAFNDETPDSIQRTKVRKAGIVEAKATYLEKLALYILGIPSEQTVGTTYDYNSIIYFRDLTQMFGEGNEPTTVEEFEAMFPNSYYEYNEGELRSIEDFSIKSVGFNQWDEEFVKKNTALNSEGIEEKAGSFWTSHFVKVLPNTEYYISHIRSPYYGPCIFEYDINFNCITKHGITNITQIISNEDQSGTFVTNNNTCYLRFIGHSTVDYSNTCINLSHSGIRNGEYEPYQEDILPINISAIKDNNGEVLFPNGLCSAGKVHDELVYDKSLSKWKAIKRIGSANMGNLKWLKYDYLGDNVFIIDSDQVDNINMARNKSTISPSNMLSVNYYMSPTYSLNDLDNAIAGPFSKSTYNGALMIKNTSYTDATAFRTSLQDQILYYELAEPIEVVLDDFTSNYKVSDWGTEEILMNTIPIVPVIYDVEYALNAVDTLRNMPTNYISKESLDAFLATLSSAMGGTWSATYNETNGRYDFSFAPNAVTTELIEE